MTDFMNNLNKVLEMLDLILAPIITKLLSCFYKAAEGSMIPCSVLKGLPGSGKTSTAEAFALAVGAKKYFYQCNPGTGFDQLIGQPNLGAVLRQDAAACVADGMVIQAVRSAMAGEDVVLILDEIDKASPEVDAYLLDFLQSRRIHDSNMEELVVPSDVKFWVFLTSNEERDLSDALMRRVRRITVDRPSRDVVASVLGIREDATLLDIWDLTEKLAISQMRNYLEDGGDPQNLDLDILSQYVDDLPDLITLAEQKAEYSVDPEIDTAPTVVYIGLTQEGATPDLISKIGSFKWLPEDTTGMLVEVPTLTELVKLEMTLTQSDVKLAVPYRNIEGHGHRMIIDHLDPVISNRHGGIFALQTPSEEIVTVVARRDADGNYYITGEEFRNFNDDFFKALPVLAKDLRRNEFKVKHAEKLSEARKAASEGQAQSLLTKLGMDDLL